MQRRGQSISVNTIIVAAIALIVLVVMVAIFTGRMGTFGKKISQQDNVYCDANTYKALDADARARARTVNGVWKPESTGCGNGIEIYGTFQDQKLGQICCSQ